MDGAELDRERPGGVVVCAGDELAGYVIRDVLAATGVDVALCRSAASALEQAPTASVVVVRLPLPDGPPAEVVDRIRRQGGWARGVVVIGSSTAAVAQMAAYGAGADAYLAAPVSPEVLRAVVNTQLHRVAARQAST